ncbi:periphilin-1 isoform X6 [Maylandia zebra]|uniref:Periphilin-1 C-terminal domain-containing protein n=1 Tax=Astatotilapia calliptera TaxID=8154 RepID=A0A3P8N9I6_ASTCA|nr:periphilin-1 isoform X5 [Maylandia zebra]
MTYRRERSIREVYDERFLTDRPGPYPRAAGGVERRGPFGRPEDDYSRGGYDYEGGPRFYPNGGGPRGYHEDQRGYHGDGPHFPAERRAIPPSRREDYPYRVPRDDSHTARPLEFGARAPPPHSVRGQGIYPAPRALPESGEDTLVQAILNLDRGEDRDHYRRKAAPFPPLRDRSPVRREVARSPHSRSGSSVSSRGYSPDRAKSLPFPSQQGKRYEETYSQSRMFDKIPGLSREGSPQSATSVKEENPPPEGEKEEPLVAPVVEESQKSTDNFHERRALAIAAKAQEIEKVYRQDCETFGMVVKMLVAKDPNLEKQLQVPLRENLGEIRERCLEDLKQFISELDDVIRQPETSTFDSTTPSTSQSGHKISKTAVNHSSSY